MAGIGSNFNPATVMMAQGGRSPYVGSNVQGGPSKFPGPPQQMKLPGTPQMQGGGTPAPQQGVLGAQSIRATGQGPFDPAYRQNLATYAGGQFSLGGNQSFNPTGPLNFGLAAGGGNAPVFGMPQTLLGQAQGGNPFSWAPPPPPQAATNPTPELSMQKDWLDRFMANGKAQRLGWNQNG